jgi:hypothetical protein
MKTKKNIFFCLLCAIALVSCGKNPIDEPLIQVDKIPLDSFYFSCKINDSLIEMKSAPLLERTYGEYIQRLYKVQNSSQDSAIIGFKYGYYNDDYNVVIGISKSCLLDTVDIKNFNLPNNIKKEIMENNRYHMRFMPPITSVRSSTNKYSGFYIEINNLKTHDRYTTYLNDFSEYNNEAEYVKLSTNSEFDIVKSTELNSEIYADYKNIWFLESTFKCKIYKQGKTSFIQENVTEGQLKGCF